MTDLTFIAPTPRKKMTKARAAAIFSREQGRCYVCTRQIRAGERWDVEHPDPLALGGSDDDADLRVICIPCHKAKTASDRGDMAKRNRAVTKSWVGSRPKRKWPKGRKLNAPYVSNTRQIRGDIEDAVE